MNEQAIDGNGVQVSQCLVMTNMGDVDVVRVTAGSGRAERVVGEARRWQGQPYWRPTAGLVDAGFPPHIREHHTPDEMEERLKAFFIKKRRLIAAAA